jgi:ribosomal protein S18 acetylase RimI-like enzyme
MHIEKIKEIETIKNLLKIFDCEFDPPLSNSIPDFYAYAYKIAEKGNVLVSYDGSAVQGFCTFYTNQPPRAYIALIAVRGLFHGQGIGGALLERCERYAFAQGCSTVELAVDLNNKGAILFYESHGYERMHKHSETQWYYHKRI